MKSSALRSWMAVAGAAWCAASVLAQIAPPPTEAPAPTKPYKPEPFVAPPAAPTPAPAAEPSPVNQRPAQPTPHRTPEAKPPLPNEKYESLVKRNAEGKLMPLEEPATWLASRHNPLITKEDWVRLEPIFAARRLECERLGIKNLDVVERVEAGEADHVKAQDGKEAVRKVRDMLAPITPEGGDFSSRLGRDGHLTDVQSRFSQKILGEYNKEVSGEIRATLPPKAKGDENQIAALPIILFMYHQRVDEVMWCHARLVEEASRSMDRVTPALPPAVAAKIKDETALLTANPSDSSRKEIMKALMARLSLEERQALLTATMDTRPKK